jgi:hypothetical protein
LRNRNNVYICPPIKEGALAQLVEQRTENPCVTGSIPVGTTTFKALEIQGLYFLTQVKVLTFACLNRILRLRFEPSDIRIDN